MSHDLDQAITGRLGGQVAAVGVAPVDRFDDAPDKHHPPSVRQDARTVESRRVGCSGGCYLTRRFLENAG